MKTQVPESIILIIDYCWAFGRCGGKRCGCELNMFCNSHVSYIEPRQQVVFLEHALFRIIIIKEYVLGEDLCFLFVSICCNTKKNYIINIEKSEWKLFTKTEKFKMEEFSTEEI